MIAIVDYGAGNLRSVQKALERVGADTEVTDRAEVIQKARKIVLPGVGAMGVAMDRLQALGIEETLKKAIQEGIPFLGICVGFQLLFESSEEGEATRGLGILPGRVRRFTSLKVPHMGWNRLQTAAVCPLWKGLPAEPYVYFCHSYYVGSLRDDLTAARTDYGVRFVSAVQKGHLFGVQFHPEKSQEVGLKILENFVRYGEA